MIKKSWVNTMNTMTISLFVALEDGLPVSESFDVVYCLEKLLKNFKINWLCECCFSDGGNYSRNRIPDGHR